MTYQEAADKYNHYVYLKDKYRQIGTKIGEFYNSYELVMKNNISMSYNEIMFMHNIICEYLDKLKEEMNKDVK